MFLDIGSIKGSDNVKSTVNKRSRGVYETNVFGTFAAGSHGKIFQDWNATCPQGSKSTSYFYLSVSGSLTLSYALRLSESKEFDLQTILVHCNGTGYMRTSY